MLLIAFLSCVFQRGPGVVAPAGRGRGRGKAARAPKQQREQNTQKDDILESIRDTAVAKAQQKTNDVGE